MINKEVLKTIFEINFNIKKDESFLVVTDTLLEDLGKQIFEYSKKYTPKNKLIVMKPLEQNGQEPPEEIAKEMLQYDVQVLITSKSLSHTKARTNANKKGARIVTMPGINEEIINRCIAIDYEEMNILNNKIISVIKNAEEIVITTKLGTNIKTKVINTHGQNEGIIHEKGKFNNLPSGEVHSGVVSEKTNGVLVIDGSMASLGKLNSLLKLTIENGYVTKIEGERSEELKQTLDKTGKQAYKIAEFGIGTNPKAIISGSVLEDEKVRGTIHMALGNDIYYGGNNSVPLHLDGIVKKPNIEVDGRLIMKNGIFLI